MSSKKGIFYSGLTQSRYIEVLSKLLTLPETDRFREPLHRVLASLTIPAAEGGVARYTNNGGLIIEEYPGVMPDLTLNGWTTATCIVRDFAERNKDEQAWDVFARSVRGLEDLVPLYDVPELANSRYRLTGPAIMQLTADGTDLELFDFRVIIPGSGTFAANIAGDPAGEVLKAGTLAIRDGDTHTLGVDLSRLSWPFSNKLMLWVRAVEDGRLGVSIGEGEYDPLAKAPRVKSYRKLRGTDIHKGWNLIDVEVPWADAELIAYPTNFAKKIAGKQFNQYHWIHVDTLGKIVAETNSEILRHYLDKWREYPSRWPEMDAYQDDRVTLERFDAKKHK